MCYYYLESDTGNPYVDEFASANQGLAPQLVPLTPEAMAAENVDSSDELAWGVQMAEKRLEFLAKVKAEKEHEEQEKARVKEQERERLVSGLTGGHPKSTARRTSSSHPHSGSSTRPKKEKRSRVERDGKCFFRLTTPSADGGTTALSPSGFSLRNHDLDGNSLSPYSHSQSGAQHSRRGTTRRSASDSYHLPPAGWPKKSLVENAFQLALTTDPLADSGEEDEDARCDYSELTIGATLPSGIFTRATVYRLHVVNRLRGRDPTPDVDERDLTTASTPINIMRSHSKGQDMSASPDTTPPGQRRFY